MKPKKTAPVVQKGRMKPYSGPYRAEITWPGYRGCPKRAKSYVIQTTRVQKYVKHACMYTACIQVRVREGTSTYVRALGRVGVAKYGYRL